VRKTVFNNQLIDTCIILVPHIVELDLTGGCDKCPDSGVRLRTKMGREEFKGSCKMPVELRIVGLR